MHRERLPKNTRLRLSGTEYIIENCIGYGGSGLVYAAKEVGRDLYRAIKELYPSEDFRRLKGQICSENETMARELETLKKRNRAREQRLSQRAERRNHQVEAVLSVCDDAEILMPDGVVFSVRNQYSIMGDLSEKGMPLWQYVSNRSPSIKEILDIMESVLRAYDRLHRDGFLHGDCQMGNLYMLGAEPEREFCGEARIIDFGEAWELTEGKSTEIGLGDPLCSTEGYIAPEILFRQDKLQLTPATDVYSLGYLLLTLADKERLSGYGNEQITYALQTNRNLRKARKEIAKEVDCDAASLQVLNRILVKALETAPEKRFQNAGEMLEEIHHLRDCLDRSCEYGVTADTLRHGALVYYEKHRDLFRTEHKAVLAPELGTKKLTIYGRGPDGEERPIQTLLEESQGKDIYIEAPGGAGKTFALSEFFVNMLEDDEIVPLYLDMQSFNEKAVQEAGDYDLVIPWLLAHQYMNDNAAERSVKEIQKLLYEDKRMLLILDNLHKVSETLRNQTIAAVNKLHTKALWLVVAGRKHEANSFERGTFENSINIKNYVRLCAVPLEDARKAIEGCGFDEVMTRRANSLMRNQCGILGLPMFFMRWIELALLNHETTDIAHGAVQILYEYFNHRLESKPVSNISEKHVLELGEMIYDVIPKLAYTIMKGAGTIGSISVDYSSYIPKIVEFGVMKETDGEYSFEHDMYISFFAGLFIAQQLYKAIALRDYSGLGQIDEEWDIELDRYWPTLLMLRLKREKLDYERIYSILSNTKCYYALGSVAATELKEWRYESCAVLEGGVMKPTDNRTLLSALCQGARAGHIWAACHLGSEAELRLDFKTAIRWYKQMLKSGGNQGAGLIASSYEIQTKLLCHKGIMCRIKHCYYRRLRFYWLKKAGKKGSPQAMESLSRFYSEQNNMSRANELLLKAHMKGAELGILHYQYELGKDYWDGYIVEKDYKKAVGYFLKATTQNPLSSLMLAVAYSKGLGVEIDNEKAVQYYKDYYYKYAASDWDNFFSSLESTASTFDSVLSLLSVMRPSALDSSTLLRSFNSLSTFQSSLYELRHSLTACDEVLKNDMLQMMYEGVEPDEVLQWLNSLSLINVDDLAGKSRVRLEETGK